MFLWKHAVVVSLTLGLGSTLCGSAFAAGLSGGETVANNTPKFVNSARVAGQVNPNTVMDVSIWLKPHDPAGLDALARNLYDPTSATYRHWLTKSEYTARFAPTAAEANKVAQFFAANNMKVVKVGADNFFVRATGTAAAISAAFHVTLNNYEVNGATVRANSGDPYIEGEAASLVKAVAGLDSMGYTHPNASWISSAKLPSGSGGVATAAAITNSQIKPEVANAASASEFNPDCFVGMTTQTFTTDGSLPKAKYTGLEYTPAAGGCGYVPINIQTAYGLDKLYAQHLDGTGQTIVILDWCGSPTIKSDANAFSKKFGLPKLTDANFQIINTPTPSYCAAPDVEINLDVEWAHAIAPGAAIDLGGPTVEQLSRHR